MIHERSMWLKFLPIASFPDDWEISELLRTVHKICPVATVSIGNFPDH